MAEGGARQEQAGEGVVDTGGDGGGWRQALESAAVTAAQLEQAIARPDFRYDVFDFGVEVAPHARRGDLIDAAQALGGEFLRVVFGVAHRSRLDLFYFNMIVI